MHLLIFGAPGVGKGTQAKVISEKYQIKHISTGDLLRAAVKNQTEMGKKAKSYMDNGELVPDEIIGEMVKEVLSGSECKNGFILDGYPRSLNQVKILQAILEELNRTDIIIIRLLADEQVLIDRLTSRRQCINCGAIVNLKLIENSETCPVCNSKGTLVKRKDDEESVIKNRLVIYNDTTKPVIDYYNGKVPIVGIEGTNDVNKVTEDIFAALSKQT